MRVGRIAAAGRECAGAAAGLPSLPAVVDHERNAPDGRRLRLTEINILRGWMDDHEWTGAWLKAEGEGRNREGEPQCRCAHFHSTCEWAVTR